jgi:sulfoxide reductase heme-binding subunit YedZ
MGLFSSDKNKLLKAALFLLALLPFLRLVLFIFTDNLGANPVEFITRDTGNWALYLLCATLAVTPLRRLTGWNVLLKQRRMLGLFSFFYACLHFTAFLWFEHYFDVAAMWQDVLERPFIAVGFIAFVLLIPLALTSNKASIRQLGRRWQQLHRLVYVTAALAILHFWWMRAGKQDFADPLFWGVILALLMAMRVYWWRQSLCLATGKG